MPNLSCTCMNEQPFAVVLYVGEEIDSPVARIEYGVAGCFFTWALAPIPLNVMPSEP